MEPLPGLSAAPLPQDIASFLQQHPALQPSTNNRVKCSLTGHELPCRLADLQAYTKGKKYQRLMTKEPFNYSQFEPHIVPSTKNPQQLFCKLTIRHINKAPQHILRHVNGKRYQKALNKYQECVALGIPFVPACLSQKQKRNRESDGKPRYKSKSFWESDESGSESGGSVDSLSDLYPEQVLSRQEAPGEEAEMNELPNQHNDDEKMDVVTQVPRKRKHAKQNPFIKKKLKKQHTGKSNNGIKF